jgi:hypothetical protein
MPFEHPCTTSLSNGRCAHANVRRCKSPPSYRETERLPLLCINRYTQKVALVQLLSVAVWSHVLRDCAIVIRSLHTQQAAYSFAVSRMRPNTVSRCYLVDRSRLIAVPAPAISRASRIPGDDHDCVFTKSGNSGAQQGAGKDTRYDKDQQ